MLFPALLVVLAASPAAALKPASCLKVSPSAAQSPLNALRACQNKARAAAVAAAASTGTPPTPAQLDQLDDDQRAEARAFFAQPQNVATGGSAAAGKLGGVKPADLERVDPKSRGGIADLQTRLQAAAGDGKNGVTPAMADDIRATLLQAQGGISPDMADLLDAVSKDGAKLTPDTMKKLQNAGRNAKSEGLDLDIDPGIEKELLNHDFESDKPAFNARQPPGSM